MVPKKSALVGSDPYFSEENIRTKDRNFDLMKGDGSAPQAEVIPGDSLHQDQNSIIPIPAPDEIEFEIPIID